MRPLMNVNQGLKSFVESEVVGTALTLLSRALISYNFLMSVYGKITGFSGTQAYMDSFGVPGSKLPQVIVAALGGLVNSTWVSSSACSDKLSHLLFSISFPIS